MANRNAHKLMLVVRKYRAQRPALMRHIGTVAINHFKLNFKRQGFLDQSVKNWKPRAFEFPGRKRAILTGLKSNGGGIPLRDSLTVASTSSRAIVSTNKAYAQIHNKGGSISVTPAMRRFFWAKYYEAMKGRKLTKKGAVSKSKANQNLNQEAEIWKNLALTKKTSFTIPRRQFMGHSDKLNGKIDRLVRKFIKDIRR